VFGDQAVDRPPIPRTLLLRRGSHRDPAVAGSKLSEKFLGETICLRTGFGDKGATDWARLRRVMTVREVKWPSSVSAADHCLRRRSTVTRPREANA